MNQKSGVYGINEGFWLAGRPTYLKVNLDQISNNLKIIRSRISEHTGFMAHDPSTKIIAIVKANAYGHGSVGVSRFLQTHGIHNFAVATALEGEELREAGIEGHIHVLGNGAVEEIPTMFDNGLIPTVATEDFVMKWWEYLHHRRTAQTARGAVVINLDTGMSRNGCRPAQLANIIQVCEKYDIPVHSIMTHFAQSWDDPCFTRQQLELFMKTTGPYRDRGYKLQVANSGAIVNNVGVDLDFVRAGILLYGQPPDTSDHCVSLTESLGYRPVISWIARPTLVKRLQPGDVVGYNKSYTCKDEETIATFPVGYGDGYHRNMFGQGYLSTPKGTKCPVVGKVSMDSITARLPDDVTDFNTFYLMTSDTHGVNSISALSKIANAIPCAISTDLNQRVPRLYETAGYITREMYI